MARSVTPTIAASDDGPDDREGYELRTPYHPRFVDELKATVPWRDRRFSGDDKTWWVSSEHGDAMKLVMLRVWEEIDVVDANGEIETLTRDGQRSAQGRFL